MNEVTFNINTQASVLLVNKLEAIHKSAFPLAVRGTLNAAAFDVKKRTLDISATQNFIRRSPTFFKRFSAVHPATGYAVNSMKAEVGMTDQGEQKAQTAIKQMVQQEVGGTITDGLDYLAASRAGNNARRVIKSKWFNKNSVLKGQAKGNNYTWKGKKHLTGGTTKSRLVNSAFMALVLKKQMIIFKGNRRFYAEVTSITKTKNGKVKINSRLLSASRAGRPSKINATHFSKEAAMRTVLRMPDFFEIEAKRNIDRIWK